MSGDEDRLRASERFDEAASADPENAAELDAWEDFSLIAGHLQHSEIVTLPPDFAEQVQRRIQDERSKRDFVLVLQTASLTGLILTLVAATALGVNWWQRLLDFVEPGNLARLSAPFTFDAAKAGLDIRTLYQHVEPFLHLLPGAFLTTTIAALLLELAIFRLLRIGPFQLKAANPRTYSHSLP